MASRNEFSPKSHGRRTTDTEGGGCVQPETGHSVAAADGRRDQRRIQ